MIKSKDHYYKCKKHGLMEPENILLRKDGTLRCNICYTARNKSRLRTTKRDDSIKELNCYKCKILKNKVEFSDYNWNRKECYCKQCVTERGQRMRCIEVSEHVTERICSHCRESKDKNAFGEAAWKLRSPYCKICRRKHYPSEVSQLKSRLKRIYGISIEKYNEMFAAQNNRCAICNEIETKKNKGRRVQPLSVDHCHDTGNVRGLLCSACNLMIGLAKNNADIMIKAAKYLTPD